MGDLAWLGQGGGNFTLLHLQKDEMTWMHQWWHFVRYPWVDLTGLWFSFIFFFFYYLLFLFLKSGMQYVQFVGFEDDLFVALYILFSDATLMENQS